MLKFTNFEGRDNLWKQLFLITLIGITNFIQAETLGILNNSVLIVVTNFIWTETIGMLDTIVLIVTTNLCQALEVVSSVLIQLPACF